MTTAVDHHVRENTTGATSASQSSAADEEVEVEVLGQVRGASTDQVGDYLRHIGRMPLLDAQEETEIARRIEVGLFAEEKLRLLEEAGGLTLRPQRLPLAHPRR
ncbi:sigma-70 factor domain-containing protein [Frondihabitans sucicola]|nr:sigma-70 factor domain-containing protein [Frondihabitans sucicola]